MISTLQSWDQAAFLAINGWGSPWLDTAMSLLSAKLPWIPVYLWLMWLAFKRWGIKKMWVWVICAGVGVGLSDYTASGILKPTVARYRPCQPEAGMPDVYLVNGKCGGKYGFASSHAANFFALAFMSSLLFGAGWKKGACFLVAGLVAWSRVYLGVHYPGDVVAGALLGLGLAAGIWAIQKVIFAKFTSG